MPKFDLILKRILKKDFLAKMSTLSGISPTEFTLYQMWQIADHIMVNVPKELMIIF